MVVPALRALDCRPVGRSGTGRLCGFRPSEWAEAPELLFGLSATHWGRGLALEAARAAATWAFETLHATRIVAATDPPNTASVKVLERLGMRFERQGRLQGLDTLFFTLDAADLKRPD